ncbi:MAG TPA: hypothetical protein PKG48_06760, partial [Bacteroidales bacterium]|nr:hypothetical protein [Bacteroidales bacterium]
MKLFTLWVAFVLTTNVLTAQFSRAVYTPLSSFGVTSQAGYDVININGNNRFLETPGKPYLPVIMKKYVL